MLLLLPKFLSHYQDGSRRDFRQAAEIVTRMARGDEVIYSNRLELGYYLPGVEIKSWRLNTNFPERVCHVVQGGNAWDPPLKVSGRVVEIAATIGRRRFDEQTNIVRVYQIWPSGARLRGGD